METLVGVGASFGVVAEVGVNTASHLVEFSDDAVLLALKHGERYRVGLVRLHEPVLLAFEPVTVGSLPPVRGRRRASLDRANFSRAEPVI